MYKLIVIFIFFTNNCIANNADTIGLQILKEYFVEATDFNVDQQGNLYIVTKNNQLKKLNEKGDSLAVYNLSKRYGALTNIDATNPLKLLLYFKNFNTLVTTDRLLQTTNIIDLRKYNVFQTNAVATSRDGQYWLYDEETTTLKKINDQGQITLQSNALRQTLKQLPTPYKIIDNNNFLYLLDLQNGVYIFDNYGIFKKQLSFESCSNIFVINQFIYGFKNDTLYKKSIAKNTTEKIPFITNTKYSKIIIASNKIYCLHSKGITVFKN